MTPDAPARRRRRPRSTARSIEAVAAEADRHVRGPSANVAPSSTAWAVRGRRWRHRSTAGAPRDHRLRAALRRLDRELDRFGDGSWCSTRPKQAISHRPASWPTGHGRPRRRRRRSMACGRSKLDLGLVPAEAAGHAGRAARNSTLPSVPVIGDTMTRGMMVSSTSDLEARTLTVDEHVPPHLPGPVIDALAAGHDLAARLELGLHQRDDLAVRRRAARRAIAGSTVRSEMNDRSATTRSTGASDQIEVDGPDVGAIDASDPRVVGDPFRGAGRSRRRPARITSAAPRCSRQSVNPPVDAPASRADPEGPVTSTANRSRAPVELGAGPGSRSGDPDPARTMRLAGVDQAGPALAAGAPPTSTRPAAMSCWARSAGSGPGPGAPARRRGDGRALSFELDPGRTSRRESGWDRPGRRTRPRWVRASGARGSATAPEPSSARGCGLGAGGPANRSGILRRWPSWLSAFRCSRSIASWRSFFLAGAFLAVAALRVSSSRSSSASLLGQLFLARWGLLRRGRLLRVF